MNPCIAVHLRDDVFSSDPAHATRQNRGTQPPGPMIKKKPGAHAPGFVVLVGSSLCANQCIAY